MPTAPSPIPVTTIGGYLGAGKTTLLNDVLSADHGLRIAVLVNDFGAISIDEKLITARDGELVSLSNGCACCSIAGDLADALDRLARLDPRPQHILLEASGVANPARIAALARAPGLDSGTTVVVADAETVRAQAADKFVGRLVRDQFVRADLVVLNKVDLVGGDTLGAVRDWIRGLAPRARLVETSFGRLPLQVLLATGGGATDTAATAAGDAHQAFESHVWTSRRRIDLQALATTMTGLPSEVVRAKGVIAAPAPDPRRHVLQLAGRRLTIEPLPDRPDITITEIVVLGLAGRLDHRALDVAFERCTSITEVSS